MTSLTAKFQTAPAACCFAPGVPSSSNSNNLGAAPSFMSVTWLSSDISGADNGHQGVREAALNQKEGLDQRLFIAPSVAMPEPRSNDETTGDTTFAPCKFTGTFRARHDGRRKGPVSYTGREVQTTTRRQQVKKCKHVRRAGRRFVITNLPLRSYEPHPPHPPHQPRHTDGSVSLQF